MFDFMVFRKGIIHVSPVFYGGLGKQNQIAFYE